MLFEYVQGLPRKVLHSDAERYDFPAMGKFMMMIAKLRQEPSPQRRDMVTACRGAA
jgi:hypothetical protein